MPWAHLDIAGVTWSKKDKPTVPKAVPASACRCSTGWSRALRRVGEGFKPSRQGSGRRRRTGYDRDRLLPSSCGRRSKTRCRNCSPGRWSAASGRWSRPAPRNGYKQLDDALWRWGPSSRSDSFLPHGTAADGNAEKQPVWLTAAEENPNGAAFLFLTDGATSDALGDYARCFTLFDGRDEAAVAEARLHWQAWKDAGHTLTYWQQGDRGWEKKA